MWIYEKRLEYPVNIKNPDPYMAQVIISQMGGPDGELSASMRYISQRYSMPYCEVAGLLTDIGVSVSILHISKMAYFRHFLGKDVIGLILEKLKKAESRIIWIIIHMWCVFNSKGT